MKNILVFLVIIITIICIACNGIDEEGNAWPDGIVYYQITSDFTYEEKIVIREAMNEWEQATGIVLFKRAPKSFVNPLRIEKDNYYWSTIGYYEFNENITILGGMNKITIIHELGHVLGLEHEHQRSDRDLYITIHYENIIKDEIYNFKIKKTHLYKQTSTPYDYNSIMHYSQWVFSVNGNPTISLLNDDIINIGGSSISIYDVYRVNLIY